MDLRMRQKDVTATFGKAPLKIIKKLSERLGGLVVLQLFKLSLHILDPTTQQPCRLCESLDNNGAVWWALSGIPAAFVLSLVQEQAQE